MALLPFADTHVLLYLIGDDTAKCARAEAVLAGRIVVSVQVMNEFANVARRRHSLSWSELTDVLRDIAHFAEVRPLTFATHQRGLLLAERWRLSLFDAMIAASALESGCRTLLSEDFHSGLVIDKQLTIVNPFA